MTALLDFAGACDAHLHIFGPYDRFPLAGSSAYTPPLAPFEAQAAMLERLKLERAVMVQPAPYRSDHSAMIDALSRSGGRLRGVGSADETISDQALDELKSHGIVGFRFVEMKSPIGDGRYPGTIGFESARALAPRLKARGLQVQLWAALEDCVELIAEARRLGLVLVLDHLAGVRPDHGPQHPAFRALLDALAANEVWVKLTYLRQSQEPLGYGDMRWAVEALASAGPGRLVWGSDWPFVRMEGREPDPAELLRQLVDWLGPELSRRILVDNPAELFGFG